MEEKDDISEGLLEHQESCISHIDDTEWFTDKMLEFEKDPQFQAEYALLDVTEKIWEMGEPKGIYRIIYWLLEWSADKLIWRKKEKQNERKSY